MVWGTRIAEEEMLLKGVFQVENNRSAVKRHMNEDKQMIRKRRYLRQRPMRA